MNLRLKIRGLSVWTKRLGQRHYYSLLDSGQTLCGMPMLGFNYATRIPEDDQHECHECANKAKIFSFERDLMEEPHGE